MSLAKSFAIAAVGMALSIPAFANDKEDHFKKMDTNSDGRISSAEHEAAATMKFDGADADKNGTLSKGELVGFMVDAKGKSGKKAEKKTDHKMEKLDVNKDGSLTRQEFMDGHNQMFSKMDGNQDGGVTMEEMKKNHDKM